MKSTMVIVNPASANGRTGKRWPKIAHELEASGIKFHHRLTTHPLEAVTLTREALNQGYKTIVAVGGDGTINEVVNGFFTEKGLPINRYARLGIIACGTGGDLVKTLRIPRDIAQVCRRLQRGSSRSLDLGKARYINHQGYKESRYFINVAGMGIDSETVHRVNHTSKALGGTLSFLWASLVTLATYRNRHIRLEINGMLRYQGKAMMVVVANGCYFGGGMKIAPNAHPDSGKFEIIVVDGMSKLESLRALPGLYQGNHLKLPQVTCMRGTNIRVVSSEKVLLQLDGEQPGCLDVEINLVPKAIKVIC